MPEARGPCLSCPFLEWGRQEGPLDSAWRHGFPPSRVSTRTVRRAPSFWLRIGLPVVLVVLTVLTPAASLFDRDSMTGLRVATYRGRAADGSLDSCTLAQWGQIFRARWRTAMIENVDAFASISCRKPERLHIRALPLQLFNEGRRKWVSIDYRSGRFCGVSRTCIVKRRAVLGGPDFTHRTGATIQISFRGENRSRERITRYSRVIWVGGER